MLQIDGLVTGIDTTSIIEGLTDIQQRQIDLLQGRRQEVADRQAAFKGVEAALLNLRNAGSRLARIQNSVFKSRSVSSSNEDLVTATAQTGSPAGVYSLKVNSLAQAHQMAAQGFSSESAEITQGTIGLRVGGGSEVEIEIDSSNNTLEGLAESINLAEAGVSASVINDGSGANGFRLLLTGSKTGTANAITITNNLAASAGEAVQPDFTGDPVQAATDASITLGSGVGAITVFNETNQVENLISGVTLNLNGVDPTKTVSVTVSKDTEAAEGAITDFVDAYNNLMQFVDSQTRFNPDSNVGGLLLGNRNTSAIQGDVRRAVLDVVTGVGTDMNRLSTIGVTVNDAGHLVLNSTKLQDVLRGRVDGVNERDVQRLFGLDAASDNPNIEFLAGSTRTVASSVPYEVDITQAATRAAITGSTALASSIVIDSSNNEFVLSVDGKQSTSMTLAEGTYTQEEFAQHLQSVVNSEESLAGRSITASVQNGSLRLNSSTYGKVSNITLVSGSAINTMGFAGSETDEGTDVVGRFIVDGVIENATGRGRLLTGDKDNAHTADIQLRVTLTEGQVQAGVDGELSISRGIAARLDQVVGKLLDPVSGRVKIANDAFDETIAGFQASIDRQTELFEFRREQLVAEFVAMESAVSQLQSTGSFLSGQLQTLPALG